jgi:crotonobetainyl-CoA:carnitine CoA-transferase CaiB-like acyl-CoA transferase
MIDGKLPETRRKAPLLGEHSNEILAELGYSERQIEELLDKGVVIQSQI